MAKRFQDKTVAPGAKVKLVGTNVFPFMQKHQDVSVNCDNLVMHGTK
jgi:hypothetical protein